MTDNHSELALRDVLLERARQDQKWGIQNHDPFTYLTILTEEVGETAKAALELKFKGRDNAELREHLYLEAVQTAAVALAIVECLRRREWKWPLVQHPKDPHDDHEEDMK